MSCNFNICRGTFYILRYTFRRAEKLHSQKDFQQVLRSSRRLVHPALFIYIHHRKNCQDPCRMGLVTSRKIGIAVKRNRVKRIIREIFRLNKHRIQPGTDIIFMPKADAVNLKYKELESVIISALERAKALTD